MATDHDIDSTNGIDSILSIDDIDSILSTEDSFCAAPTIPFTSPVEDIIRVAIEHSESGVPFVITGFPLVEDEQSPFRQQTEWMESMYTSRGVSNPGFLPTLSLTYLILVRSGASADAHSAEDAHSATGEILNIPSAERYGPLTRSLNPVEPILPLILPCPPEWVTWLQDSFTVPSCLIPHGGDDLLPEGTQSTSLRLFGSEQSLSDVHVCHQLLTGE